MTITQILFSKSSTLANYLVSFTEVNFEINLAIAIHQQDKVHQNDEIALILFLLLYDV